MAVFLFKAFCGFLYFLLKKFLSQKKRVVLITRRLNYTSIDFKYLESKLHENFPKYDVVILNHKMRSKMDHGLSVLVEMFYLATSKAAIVDSYIIPVSILKHRPNMVIVQIWHALGAVKKFGHQSLDTPEGSSSKIARTMKMHNGYTWVCAGSDESKHIFSEAFKVDEEKVLPIGEPRVDYLVEQKGDLNNTVKKKIYKKYPQLSQKKVLLYAPTFRKSSSIKLENLVKCIDFNKYQLVLKLHPVDKKTHLKNNSLPKGVIIDDSFEVIDFLLAADVVITDYSALIFEATLLEKPIYFWVYDIDKYKKFRGLNYDFAKFAPGYFSKNPKEIMKAIDNNECDLEKVREFSKKYIAVQNGTSTQQIIDLLNLK